ncbi:MAG: CDP-glycerol glycerophosphotransferase family protein [Gemmatimonadaceae bacterium]|nr:CDP-glycerol glycerophosphotransferase family protein [Gemmatimonadaceae bacterium]
MSDRGPIQFSIVTAVSNVSRYLDDFIESIERQTYPRERFEVIAVDDGSTEESLATLRAWEEQRPNLVRVVTKESGVHSSARNAGLDLARGHWVTFTDPDDILAPDYLSEVAAFLEENTTLCLVATNRLIDAGTGLLADTHPLRRNFAHGNRLRDLGQYPDHIHSSPQDAFFSCTDLRRRGIRFDVKAGPSFEDAHFTARYLLGVEQPVIGFVPTARYQYRKRPELSALNPQTTITQPERYIQVLRNGFVDVLRQGAEAADDGPLPEWLENLVLYELSWYITSRDADAGAMTEATRRLSDEIHELLAAIRTYISEDAIKGFAVRPMTPAWKDFLLHGFESEWWRQSFAHVARLDADQGIVRITYRFTGDPPAEQILAGGEVVRPTHAKVRDIAYQGRIMMRQRVLWLSASQSVRLRLDGRDMDLQFTEPRANHTLRPGQIKDQLGRKAVLAARARARRRRSLKDRLILRLARTRPVRFFFKDAWVLMDRVTDAGDNAERLFRYLRRSRRRINAWFVVEGGSSDWKRLRSEGYLRVVPYGSLRWKLLMANCRHLVSSHVGAPVMRPPELLSFMVPRWRFTFLQHGVIHSNLARWFNSKSIDLFITSSFQEYASIAGDHTPYSVTTKEVKLTGLPRWDRLRAMDEQLSVEKRDLVLVAPTWRNGLVPLLLPRPQRRAIDPAFFVSAYAQNWMALLKSSELAEACERQGLMLGFLPHPNVQPALAGMKLPPNVRALTFADNDVQELFARSAVFVTDYSSMAFDAAYVDRPVVYFQFDRDTFLGGAHHGRRGYFDFDLDGFGPVTYTAEDAIQAVIDTIQSGRTPPPMYQARMKATFPLRDGECCKRVVDEIERSTRRLSSTEAAVSEPTPRMPDR